jgi:dipeptidyl aminopeptidase/acylaminoacyl peptidase
VARTVTLKDVLAHAPVLGSAISADGRWVAASVALHDPATDARRPVLHVRELDGDGDWTVLGGEGDVFHDPSFAPDGRLAAFRTRGRTVDVVVLDPARPDAPALEAVGLPPAAVALKWWGTPGSLAVLGHDGEGTRRLWAWDRLDERPRPVSTPRRRVGDFAFAPGSDRLAWLHAPARTVGGEEPGTTLYWTSALTRRPVAVPVPEPLIGQLVWSPDGRWLAGLGRPLDTPLAAPRLWAIAPATGEARRLLDGVDGWITGLDWRPGGDALVVGLEQGVAGVLWEAPLKGPPRPLGAVDTYESGPKLDRTRGRLLSLRQDATEPQHLRLREPDDPASVRISAFDARLADVAWRPQETMRWVADDGLGIEGLLMLPERPRPPVIVWLHGGPAEHLQRTFSAYFQLLVAQGWAVLAPNVRGSTGRSDDFLRAVVGRLGDADVGDVLAGLRALGDRVDTDRVAFVGWSYGGSLALGCASTWRGTRAVLAGAPVVDWLTVFGARSWPSLTPHYFPCPPWVDPAPYDRASPIRRLGSLRAPTLLLHGEEDDRVPPSQSRLLYRMLQVRGVTTDLRLFPGEGHVFAAPWAIREMLARAVAWFRTHLDPRADDDGR